MSLPRTFVGFSSTDKDQFSMMRAWKEHENIDFNFCDCQLPQALNSTDEKYIKYACRERLEMAGTYILLIGKDTRFKIMYVKWEAEVAIDKWRFFNPATCPSFLNDVGALFVPFSPHIIQYALEHFVRMKSGNWDINYSTYHKLGYILNGNLAEWPKPKPLDQILNYQIEQLNQNGFRVQ